MVTFEEMQETYGRRAAAQADAEVAEASRLTPLLPVVARHLRELGAAEVYLFGSLAEGRFRAGSDVDLATRGLGFHEALKAISTCGELLECAVDVVRLEDAPATLVARVMQTGTLL